MKNCYIIDFKPIGNKEIGHLIALEENRNIPFDIKRVYYTYGVPTDVKRGSHAHKNLEQVLICTNGSLKVRCFDGKNEKIYELNSPDKGIYLGTMLWHDMFDYNDSTIVMVLASNYYSEDDYIRDYEEFLNSITK